MCRSILFFIIFAFGASLFGQEEAVAPPTPIPSATPVVMPPEPHHGLWWALFHSSRKTPPKYKNKKLEGLLVEVQVSPQPVKLSETRQLQVKAVITNRGRKSIELDFPTDQRIEIYLMTTEQTVLTKWSDNHAFNDKAGTILINPGEHVEYNESISTRDLVPNKVFVAEVFLPKYPEVRARQKFMTAQ